MGSIHSRSAWSRRASTVMSSCTLSLGLSLVACQSGSAAVSDDDAALKLDALQRKANPQPRAAGRSCRSLLLLRIETSTASTRWPAARLCLRPQPARVTSLLPPLAAAGAEHRQLAVLQLVAAAAAHMRARVARVVRAGAPGSLARAAQPEALVLLALREMSVQFPCAARTIRACRLAMATRVAGSLPTGNPLICQRASASERRPWQTVRRGWNGNGSYLRRMRLRVPRNRARGALSATSAARSKPGATARRWRSRAAAGACPRRRSSSR